MNIEFLGDRAIFLQVVGVDDAEGLLAWLQCNPAASADLHFCTHLHPANLQVLMAAGTPVCAWPDDAALAAWLHSVLKEQSTAPPDGRTTHISEANDG